MSAPGGAGGEPRVLMLGMGWFPSTPGGLNRYYRSLLEQLPAASGVVVAPAGDAPARVHAVAGPSTALPLRLLRFWLNARALARDARLLDAHFALYAALPVLLGRRGGPLVFHFHGPWARESLAAGDSSRARHALRAWLERAVVRRADAHVALSSAFRRVLVERYRVSPWEVHVLAPGVDLDRFNPGGREQARAALGLDPGAFVAVCVRRLVPRMGIEGLIDAWGRIAGGLAPGSTLLIAGDGPLREQLARRAGAGVRVIGRVSEDDLARAYRAADVAVVPTLALEGFGLIVLEAAASGTPSIVTDVGGLPEALAPLDRSLIVPPADTDALAARIASAAGGALPSRAGTRSYAERFSWPGLAERHRALYRRLLAGERDERRRVVYVDHVARLSGGEIALMRLLTRLEQVQPHVILGEDGPLADRLQRAGVSVEVLPIASAARDLRREEVRLGGASPAAALHTALYMARLARRLRALKPDLVHTNSLKSGIYGSLAARAAGVPVVWHVRDRIAEDYIPPGAVRLVRAMIGRLADGVVANSDATLATVATGPLGRAGRTPSWVLPSPVEIPPAARAHGPGPATFGMLGRIAPWKGQDLFLRAFAKAFPEGEQRAVLIGGPLFGEQAFERQLHELAGALGIAERVELRGFREDVFAELARLDVLVHASLVPEPFGTVVLEGMAAGLAVIAPDAGGPAEVVEHERTGLLFASRDEAALTRLMRRLDGDPRERARLGAAARQALDGYRPERIAARLEQVYEQLLGD